MKRFIQYVAQLLGSLRSKRSTPRRRRLELHGNLFPLRRELRRDIYRRLQALKLVTRRNVQQGTTVGTS